MSETWEWNVSWKPESVRSVWAVEEGLRQAAIDIGWSIPTAGVLRAEA